MAPVVGMSMKFKSVAEGHKLFSGNLEYDLWEIELEYKGKQVKTSYATVKGEFKQPDLDHVINSMFTNAIMYQRYKNDFSGALFAFKSSGVKPKDVKSMIEGAKIGYDVLLQLFGENYKMYEKYYHDMRPIKGIIRLNDMLQKIEGLKSLAKQSGMVKH
ncbi:hypothetical protein [Bacillus bombysepticus]|uniref:hypothetical protein n=1 Tax=Bacillus bombysepticus TaxID=658666 RepID=UPI00301AB7AF